MLGFHLSATAPWLALIPPSKAVSLVVRIAHPTSLFSVGISLLILTLLLLLNVEDQLQQSLVQHRILRSFQ